MRRRSLLCLAMLCVIAPMAAHADELMKRVDRRFPVFFFCPLDHLSFDLTFVADGDGAVITFAADNRDTSGAFNGHKLDNIAITDIFTFQSNLVVTPNYETCYASPGQSDTPSYDFDAFSTPEAYLERFDTNAGGWSTTSGASFLSGSSAPRFPVSGNDTTGGSLALGSNAQGSVRVSTSRAITGLTAGQTYVLTGWWSAQNLVPLDITIRTTCSAPDADGDTHCSLADCNDANPAIWGTPDEPQSVVLTQATQAAPTTIGWSLPVHPGAAAPVYDTLRSTLPYDFFDSTTCVEANGADRQSTDAAKPPAGQTFYYLVRAESGCRNSVGALGNDRVGLWCIPPPACPHDVCHIGGPLDRFCDFCSETVCSFDNYCCNIGWDAICVQEAIVNCGASC